MECGLCVEMFVIDFVEYFVCKGVLFCEIYYIFGVVVKFSEDCGVLFFLLIVDDLKFFCVVFDVDVVEVWLYEKFVEFCDIEGGILCCSVFE